VPTAYVNDYLTVSHKSANIVRKQTNRAILKYLINCLEITKYHWLYVIVCCKYDLKNKIQFVQFSLIEQWMYIVWKYVFSSFKKNLIPIQVHRLACTHHIHTQNCTHSHTYTCLWSISSTLNAKILRTKVFSLLRVWLWRNFRMKNAQVKCWWNWHLDYALPLA